LCFRSLLVVLVMSQSKIRFSGHLIILFETFPENQKQIRIMAHLEITSYATSPLKIQNYIVYAHFSVFIFYFSYSRTNLKKNCISFIWFLEYFDDILYLFDFIWHVLSSFLLCFLVVFKSEIHYCWNVRDSNFYL